MSQETSDLTVKKQAGVPSTSLFEADAKLGLENMDQDDLALPFLKLLQNSSDETKKKHASYVDGAEPGMFYNTVTKKLYDGAKGIEVIPCFYKLTFPEWAPFERREGRPVSPDRGADVLSQTKKDASGKDVLTNGNIIIKTANHFVIILTDSMVDKALVAMKSTQLKVSRGWNSMMKSITEKGQNSTFNPPSFSHIYQLRSIEVTGNFTWYGYNVKLLRKVDNVDLYQQAKAFHASIKSAQAKAAEKEDTNF
jgi:hypothetical protein|tara:strand:- start:3398 stop:4153 length:756 start_codon:yes stop_codon:yes gene_type:complete